MDSPLAVLWQSMDSTWTVHGILWESLDSPVAVLWQSGGSPLGVPKDPWVSVTCSRVPLQRFKPSTYLEDYVSKGYADTTRKSDVLDFRELMP
jgi:hypothetical protein